MILDELKQINNSKIEYYENLKQSDDNNQEIQKELDIHLGMKKLFDQHESLFFEIQMDDALKLLGKLVPEDEVQETYKKLIGVDSYLYLRRNYIL